MRYGADVDIEKKKLDAFELAVLKFVYEVVPDVTAKKVEGAFSCGDRKASSTLSKLVGMDLVKSSEYRTMLTDEETKRFETTHTPIYFITRNTRNPWELRAKLVIEIHGYLRGLDEMQFGLNMWPLRFPVQYYSMQGEYHLSSRFLWKHNDQVFELKVMKVRTLEESLNQDRQASSS